MFRSLCDFIGIDTKRIVFSWVSAAEGARWAELVNSTVASIRELGPYVDYRNIANKQVMEVENHG